MQSEDNLNKVFKNPSHRSDRSNHPRLLQLKPFHTFLELEISDHGSTVARLFYNHNCTDHQVKQVRWLWNGFLFISFLLLLGINIDSHLLRDDGI